MFQISALEDKAVRILPANLTLRPGWQLEAIPQQIEATYVDKVCCTCDGRDEREVSRAAFHRAGATGTGARVLCSTGCFCA